MGPNSDRADGGDDFCSTVEAGGKLTDNSFRPAESRVQILLKADVRQASIEERRSAGIDLPFEQWRPKSRESKPMTKHEELIREMKAGNCDTVQQLLSKHSDLVNSSEWTPPPLHCAVLWDQPEVANVLLDNGADIEMKDPDRQTTPFRYSIVYAKPRMIKLLLSRGASVNPIVDGGTTALQMARDAANGSLEEFEELPSRDEYREIVALLIQLGIEA